MKRRNKGLIETAKKRLVQESEEGARQKDDELKEPEAQRRQLEGGLTELASEDVIDAETGRETKRRRTEPKVRLSRPSSLVTIKREREEEKEEKESEHVHFTNFIERMRTKNEKLE